MANLRLPTFGEEHAPEDTGGKEGAKRVMGRGFLWEPCKIRDSLHHGRKSPAHYLWNDSWCAVPYCRYKCQGDHKAFYCRAYPASRLAQPTRASRKEGKGVGQGLVSIHATHYCVRAWTTHCCVVFENNIRVLQRISHI